uniref:Cytochrome c oxidase assembly protein COX11, mitochondrial n=1 Tax=Zonotrichia albicollis TaxID=44394 RepID=A0A8D2NG35_ZONAL
MALCGRGWARCARGLRLGALPRPGLCGTRGVRGSNPFTRQQEEEWRRRNRSTVGYIAAAAVGMVGLSYAAVPLYRLYCQATGLGGTAGTGGDPERIERMEPVRDRLIRVTFNADTHASMQWNFKPQQSEIYVVPGETALAFYKAKNPTDKPIIGISTYNVVPFEAGQYFNKIQVSMNKAKIALSFTQKKTVIHKLHFNPGQHFSYDNILRKYLVFSNGKVHQFILSFTALTSSCSSHQSGSKICHVVPL